MCPGQSAGLCIQIMSVCVCSYAHFFPYALAHLVLLGNNKDFCHMDSQINRTCWQAAG